MRLFIFKLTVYLVLFAGIGNYIVYLMTGRVPLNELWQRYGKVPTSLPTPSIPSVELPNLSKLTGRDDSAHKAFKWTDSSGVIHYSDQPPDGQDAKLIDMNPDQNLVQGTPLSKEPQVNSSKHDEPEPASPGQIELQSIKQKIEAAQKASLPAN
jgi:Domain of unknown function (DUF4124)